MKSEHGYSDDASVCCSTRRKWRATWNSNRLFEGDSTNELEATVTTALLWEMLDGRDYRALDIVLLFVAVVINQSTEHM